MKVAKLPTVHSSQCWIVLHDLIIAQNRVPPIEPIHAFTFLAQHAGSGSKSARFSLGLALESKLFAVRHCSERLARLSNKNPKAEPSTLFLRDYLAEDRVLCALEAYLASTYAALEIAAKLNKHLDHNLPSSFHDQTGRCEAFSIATWPWLARFFDLRSEITHCGSPLPIVEYGELIIEFRTKRKLAAFRPGRQVVRFSEILSYGRDLRAMLNRWARKALVNIKADAEIDTLSFPSPRAPGTPSKGRAHEILALVSEP